MPSPETIKEWSLYVAILEDQHNIIFPLALMPLPYNALPGRERGAPFKHSAHVIATQCGLHIETVINTPAGIIDSSGYLLNYSAE